MRSFVLAFGAIAVMGGGCVTGSAVDSQNRCTTGNPSYLRTWDCIKSDIASNRAGNMNNDLGLRYIATGDALAERVRQRSLSDAEAKRLLANELVAANQQYADRSREAGNAMSAVGAALLAPQPQTYQRPLTCNSRTIYGTTSTQCF